MLNISMGFGEKKSTFKTWQHFDMGNIFHLIIVLTIFFQRSKCTHWLMNNILFFQLHLVAIWYVWTFISYNLIIFFPNMRGGH